MYLEFPERFSTRKYTSFDILTGLLDAITKGLLSDEHVISSRVLAINITNGVLATSVWWSKNIGALGGPSRVDEDGVQIGFKPNTGYPW